MQIKSTGFLMQSVCLHECAIPQYAKKVARWICPGKPLLLFGPMGVGKSTFARSVLRTLLPDVAHIPSPSFPIMIAYAAGQETIWHVDLYRINHFSDIAPLGLAERIRTDHCLIEWPDRLGPLMPESYISVSLDFISTDDASMDYPTEKQAFWRQITIDVVGRGAVNSLERKDFFL